MLMLLSLIVSPWIVMVGDRLFAVVRLLFSVQVRFGVVAVLALEMSVGAFCLTSL